ncbi:hypothetical protein BVK86_20300 [Pseudomonas reinekei]|nr:hypothetical protein BVK86_20300 [Pseudomonas reinekei]
MASGVYVTENIDSIPRIKPNIKSSHVTQEGVATAIASIQSHFTTLDKMSDRVMRQAGIKGQPNNVYLGEIPWKADDSDWFKAHPNRSHRMRPIYSGEAVTLSKELIIPPPLENHRYEILVRQVEVGKRIRTVFCRNTKAYIPDEEEVIHAIFDIVSRSGTTGVLTFNEVEALAVRYNISLSAKPH